MGLESGPSLPGEHPSFKGMRFVCDYCGEAMLSRDGVALELPVERGGEINEGLFELTEEGRSRHRCVTTCTR